MLNHQVMMDHMYAMRKFPTPGAELFGKGCANPHPVPGGGGVGHFIDTCITCGYVISGLCTIQEQNVDVA